MGYIVCQLGCRTAYLQVKTTSESSITGGTATEFDGRTKVGVGGGGYVEIAEIESQTAKSEINDFQKAGLRIVLFGLRQILF